MMIKDNRHTDETYLFRDIRAGSCFEHRNAIYIRGFKKSAKEHNGGDWFGYGVNLATGEIKELSNDAEVSPVTIEATIK